MLYLFGMNLSTYSFSFIFTQHECTRAIVIVQRALTKVINQTKTLSIQTRQLNKYLR